MHDRFVPPSYHRDLRKKLMCLEQGDKSIQDYYGELCNTPGVCHQLSNGFKLKHDMLSGDESFKIKSTK